MPSDYDPDLARLYAMRLAEQTPPTYDDGASTLMRDPAMMDVGLFGKGPKPKPVAPPVELQRRKLLGLGEAPVVKPAQSAVPLSPAMQQLSEIDKKPYATAPLQSTIQNAVNTPMSRRQFLEKTGKAAANTALRGALPELGKYVDVPYEVVKPNPLAQTANVSDYSAVNDKLKDALHQHISEYVGADALDMPYAWGIVRGLVDENKFDKNELKKLDKLHDLASEGNYNATIKLEQSLDKMISNIHSDHVLDALSEVVSSIAYGELQPSDVADILRDDVPHELIHEYLDVHHPWYDKEIIDRYLLEQYERESGKD